MELRHLRYFRAVAEELHFGRAAQRLHMAQPPLSQQIRQLEDELGLALLVRSTRRVELTAAGEDYLRQTVAILDSVDAAGRRAQRIAEGRQGNLAIGCVGSATYSLLPRFVRALRNELPDVDVSVRGEMLAPEQMAALVSGDIDLALLRMPVETRGLHVESIRKDRLIVALPADHPLTETPAQQAVDIAQLRGEDFIAHVGGGRSVISGVLAAACERAGFMPRIRHEVEETSTLVTLVAAGLGVAVVPEPTSALGVAGVEYRPLAAPIDHVDLAVAFAVARRTPLIDRAVAVLRTLP
ncbi:LysR family transcriptional regulator [Gordonia sp. zg691]|uniref:LysR family transcriptional regulator n=1 Tax=Gordonia jinghuaiqii TaxID=2758710 RepID=A0A7D7LVS2_9ACTN|nr:LysR substrate-binding domain-containing protein [Gordonia jinghuaiqii]MBD0863598.1 LysR family transcriptional regulator [Gordonia jinghuaiqii]MCR5979334.1 LysR family transcriptional regulator [Gordonia jinghuaiqii]QMT01119.1 LysR family transcriptional regulator [Gordonia jinghuaiqii]